MKKNWKLVLSGTVLAAAMTLPAVSNAGFNEETEAHFHFHGHAHHPLILKAANQLREARQTIWSAPSIFHGHKTAALAAVDAALDELRKCEEVR